jgi:hypothetical protein
MSSALLALLLLLLLLLPPSSILQYTANWTFTVPVLLQHSCRAHCSSTSVKRVQLSLLSGHGRHRVM